jgi:hypothetical protein
MFGFLGAQPTDRRLLVVDGANSLAEPPAASTAIPAGPMRNKKGTGPRGQVPWYLTRPKTLGGLHIGVVTVIGFSRICNRGFGTFSGQPATFSALRQDLGNTLHSATFIDFIDSGNFT